MASVASDGAPPQPTMTMFSGIDNVTIHDGKFTQVFGDYHVHRNTDTTDIDPVDWSSTANTPNATGGIQVGRDYHVHHHYPTIKRRNYFSTLSDVEIEVSTALPRDPHYHVFRGGDIMFCTKFSPVYQRKSMSLIYSFDRNDRPKLFADFPVNPSYEAMKKYASIILDEIDAGLYRDMGFRRRPEYFRRYMPRSFNSDLPRPTYGTYVRYQPTSPKFGLKDYIPPFDLHIPEDDRDNIHMFPCMHAHTAARKSSASAIPSPREALFSHLDHSGVK